MMQAEFHPEDRFNILGRGVVITGSVTSGTLRIGMVADIGGLKIEVNGLEVVGKKTQEVVVSRGDKPVNVGLAINDVRVDVLDNLIQSHAVILFNGDGEGVNTRPNGDDDLAIKGKNNSWLRRVFGIGNR